VDVPEVLDKYLVVADTPKPLGAPPRPQKLKPLQRPLLPPLAVRPPGLTSREGTVAVSAALHEQRLVAAQKPLLRPLPPPSGAKPLGLSFPEVPLVKILDEQLLVPVAVPAVLDKQLVVAGIPKPKLLLPDLGVKPPG